MVILDSKYLWAILLPTATIVAGLEEEEEQEEEDEEELLRQQEQMMIMIQV